MCGAFEDILYCSMSMVQLQHVANTCTSLHLLNMCCQEQDKSSVVEQQPSFGDRKIKQYTASKEGGNKTNVNII